jgi:hypothetical protein
MGSSPIWIVGVLGKGTTNCDLKSIFKNLRFKNEEIGRGGREYGVSIA